MSNLHFLSFFRSFCLCFSLRIGFLLIVVAAVSRHTSPRLCETETVTAHQSWSQLSSRASNTNGAGQGRQLQSTGRWAVAAVSLQTRPVAIRWRRDTVRENRHKVSPGPRFRGP